MKRCTGKAESGNRRLDKVIGAACCILVCTFLCGCVDSGAANARIEEYGVFRADAVKDVKADGTALKRVVTLGNIELTEQTASIEAKKGVRFGVKYRFDGADDTVLTVRLKHPPITNPVTMQTSIQEQWQQKSKAGNLSYAGFTMDSEWEMVPGEWTFEIWLKDEKLAEKSFTVTRR